MKHPPGTIGISLGPVIRSANFVMCLNASWRPRGTRVMLGQSTSIPKNMNLICRNMSPGSEWLWIQADDQIWNPRTALKQLLDRQLDVVVPLILRRGPPFVPVINKTRTKAGHVAYGYEEIPTEGLLEVEGVAGTGGMLIRRHVLDAISEQQGHDRIFEVDKGDHLAEDYVLTRKIRKAGFRIFCDVEVTMGHESNFTIWPERNGTGWRLRFDMGTGPDGRVSHFFVDPSGQQGG